MGRLATLRGLVARFGMPLLIVLAFAIMLFGRADNGAVVGVRTAVVDAVAPVIDVVSRPAAAVANAVSGVEELASIRAENARLRQENEKLQAWRAVARRLEADNARLRRLLAFTPMPRAEALAARVIADSGGSFAHSMVLNAGKGDGVEKGDTVMTGEGLAGRVAEVGQRSARVLLLTDLNSRIPVVVERTREDAILAGDNKRQARLVYMAGGDENVVTGDRVVTSGDGGVFPPGLPVGVVAATGKDGVRVEPHVHFANLEFVRVLDFGLDKILTDQPRVAEKQ